MDEIDTKGVIKWEELILSRGLALVPETEVALSTKSQNIKFE